MHLLKVIYLMSYMRKNHSRHQESKIFWLK